MTCNQCKDLDYGMATKVWGPPAWFFLHMVTFGFPKDPLKYDRENKLASGTTQQRYRDFFNRVGFILPCRSCRESYQSNIQKFPIDISNRDSLVKWLFNIHNLVNKKLNKISLEFNIKLLDKSEYQCNKQKKTCLVLTKNGKKINYDSDHHTLEGASFLGKKIFDLKWLNLN